MANLSPIQLTPTIQTGSGDAPNAGVEDGNSGFSEELQGAISLQSQKSEESVVAIPVPESPDLLPRPEDLALQILPLVNWVPGVLPANFASSTVEASAQAIQEVAPVSDAAAPAGLTLGMPGVPLSTLPEAVPQVPSDSRAQASMASALASVPTALQAATSAQASGATLSQDANRVMAPTPLEAASVTPSEGLAQLGELSSRVASVTDNEAASPAQHGAAFAMDGAHVPVASSAQAMASKPVAETTQIQGPAISAQVVEPLEVLASNPSAGLGAEGTAKVLAATSASVQVGPVQVASATQETLVTSVAMARSGTATPEINHAEPTLTLATQPLGDAAPKTGNDSASTSDAAPALLPSAEMARSTTQASPGIVVAATEAASVLSAQPSPAVAVSQSIQTASDGRDKTLASSAVTSSGTVSAAMAEESSTATAGVSTELLRATTHDAKQESASTLSGLDPLGVDEASGVKASMASMSAHHGVLPAKEEIKTTGAQSVGAGVETELAATPSTLSTVVRVAAREDEDAMASNPVVSPVLRELDGATPQPPLTTFLSTLIGQPVVSHASKETAWLPTATAPHPLEPHEVKLDSGQVQVEILRMVKQGGGQVVMELTPPDQSKFRIDLQIDAQGQATLVVEGASDSTRTRLEQGASSLQQQFAEMGLQLQLDMRQSRDFGARHPSEQMAQEGGANAASGSATTEDRAETLSAQRAARREAFEGNVHLYA